MKREYDGCLAAKQVKVTKHYGALSVKQDDS